MLYNVIVKPIEIIVSWVFSFISIRFSRFGIMGAVFGVSLIINFLALPLYNIADSLQEKEREITRILEPRVKRIKKAFKGNEQFMMLSTYYRQNNYHPLYVLRSSLSILIEIPFFVAAYHFLSNCEALKGSSFWLFDDLGSPDLLLSTGNFPIHILPIIMTLINFLSGAIYTKDAPFREKIQLYIVAMLFLMLLYNSPSGLVIYWILNNVFSLVKNIVVKTKNPKKILHLSVSFILLSTAVYFCVIDGDLWKKAIFCLFSLFVSFFPLITGRFRVFFCRFRTENKPDFSVVMFSGLALALLCGLLLPASVISTSPVEFSFLGSTDSPVVYVYHSFLIFIGFFVFWGLVIYKMFGDRVKKAEETLLFVFLVFALTNVYVCKPDLIDISPILTYSIGRSPAVGNVISLISLIAGFAVFTVFRKFRKNVLSVILFSLCFAECVFGFIKISYIKRSFNDYKTAKSGTTSEIEDVGNISPVYNLSKKGKNVVVLFLDRAVGSFVPYIFDTVPELKTQFSGFVYYPNTISFGVHTVFGFPPLAGGYEYTQEKINQRDSELLVSKHNEAMLVMPKIFLDAGYDVTFTDPPYSNYRWKGDFTPFKKYPQIHVSEEQGKLSNLYKRQTGFFDNVESDELCKQNMIVFSVLQIMPPVLRPILYDFTVNDVAEFNSLFAQISHLYYLPDQTSFSNDKDGFVFIENDLCHESALLNSPDYLIPVSAGSSGYTGVFDLGYEDAEKDFSVNAAALKQVGKWLDYLRQNNCYDNTRIIIVSDHGYYRRYPDFADFENPTVPAGFNPLLMYKDFNCNFEMKTDDMFMTNADTLFLAKQGLDISDTNPFTGKEFIQEKSSVNVYHKGFEEENNAEHIRNKKQFVLKNENGWHVSDDIFNPGNWIPLTEWKKMNGGAE